MSDVFNNNREPISDCEKESSNRPYEPGKFYNGNEKVEGGYKLKGEGSLGLLYDQGAIRLSEVPEIQMFSLSSDSSQFTVKEDQQGSASHLKI